MVVFVLIALSSEAQESIDREQKIEYCEVSKVVKPFNQSFFVYVLRGGDEVVRAEKQYLRNKKGEKLEFYSMIEVLNFLGRKRWELIDFYPKNVDNDLEKKWLLKRTYVENK